MVLVGVIMVALEKFNPLFEFFTFWFICHL